ncbi:MAG: 50S ribosomal protein L32e [Candidatus Diapherotrites archaeon]|nr:50S ribosomal protein L32e [Candidatus Diapherotrites archaeon]
MALKQFKRNEHYTKKLKGKGWRKPRGIYNKRREGVVGKGAMPKIGYGTKASIRGLHPSGKCEVLVSNPSEAEGLDKEINVIRIAGTVGKKKRIDIVRKAKELGVRVLNAGDFNES